MSAWLIGSSCSNEKPVSEREGAIGLGRASPASIFRRRSRCAVLDQRDRPGRRGPRRIERMRTIRYDEDEIHLRAQIDEIARSLASLLPAEATDFVERYRREEAD